MKSTGSLIKTLLILVVVFTAVVLSPRTAMAQTYDQELAAQYMNAREFDKAAILWEQLYDKYRYRQYLTNYLKCLSELKEFEKAEKFIKKEVKRNENDPSLLVELGLVYVAMGNTQDADAQFNKAIKLSAVSKAQTINTANYFLTNRMFDYAEVLYTTAAAQQKVNFDFELANLYYFQRNYQRMTEKFLDLLFEFPDYLNSVESRYQYIMASSTEDDLNQLLET
ncbi:MAG: tetratricopeptide repeat protein, partial [Bacteroidales bacterium]|nr:tetratricopeptide repeat protein [Bacteroidales bacterium]